MLKIGITGGIGSGKTTVCRLFEEHFQVPIYYADDRAKWLMNNSSSLKEKLISTFGSLVYDTDGNLDRPYLSNIVFNDKSKLEVLNGIVHPAVFEDGATWQAEQEAIGAPYTLKEAALLFETGSYLSLDKIIVVTVPDEIRIERVMSRDNISREEVLARIAKQMPQQEKEKMADFLITNIDRDSLLEQVKAVHEALVLMC